ncbi:hypothetical protein SPRG_06845 [Saprolegnia parasitica CBS 223.65]|uniref:Uncharacterized protein n=1 Tax=Saprolegnia parasitica (strain CBS 223.65) TaxID=695850 RepID=A0A067CL94_SAPPC|nr:hypothetical protein SPRG_06845 [Saprolegnia parasitica CBS 223.65]KDO27577.1 hypothetical protein SPRG_06845 [Saprolegnia parasitica CBS 223.65]|eukprot:XP_012201702.1 hypothetical protein SPRG_06845 [Saprolegnia parasitica CBS 223.65]
MQRVLTSRDLMATIFAYQAGYDGLCQTLPARWMTSAASIEATLGATTGSGIRDFLGFIDTSVHALMRAWHARYGPRGLLRLAACRHPIVPILLDEALATGHYDRWLLLVTAQPTFLPISHVTWHDAGFASTWRRSTLDVAVVRGSLPFVRFLHLHGVVGSWWVLDWAAEHGHLDILRYLHATGRYFCTPRAMDLAAHNGHLEVVKFLHYCRREGGSTWAIDWAAKNGHLHIVEFLHRKRDEGCTADALTGAAANGHLAVVQFLYAYRHEGDVTAALEAAASRGHLHVVQFLCDCVGGAPRSVRQQARAHHQWAVLTYLGHLREVRDCSYA